MKHLPKGVSLLVVLLLFPFELTVLGVPQDARQHETQPTPDELKAQIAELRALVMRLETALLNELGASTTSVPAPTSQPAMGMGRMGGMRDMSMGDAQGMSTGGMQSMSMGGKQGMSMSGMGGMSRMGAGTHGDLMNSALPGIPGVSHIYHVGATGFFVDHPDHIALTVEQRQQLNAIKERTLLSQSTRERQIQQTEQELRVLTASDRPEIGAIEAKVREDEGLRCDQRLEFIRAVGEAATVLTEAQRLQLVGQYDTASTQPAADSDHQH